MRRYELPPTTPDCVSIDHRRTAAFAPGELNAYFRAAFDLTADVKIYVEAVHRLNDVGTVCTHVTHGVSHEGFAAEWREVDVLMVEGNIVNHCELFDEADIDAALAKFKELSPDQGRLKNAASQVAERFMVSFTAGDWGAIAEMLADNFSSDDRRRVVGAGVRLGRDAQIADVRAIADLWIMRPTVMATRGDRLVLMRVHFSGRDQGPEAFVTDVLGVVEINAYERIVATVAFGIDDIDAAFEELDARYLAGEAAAHAKTWSRHRTGQYRGQPKRGIADDARRFDDRPPGAHDFERGRYNRVHSRHVGPHAGAPHVHRVCTSAKRRRNGRYARVARDLARRL